MAGGERVLVAGVRLVPGLGDQVPGALVELREEGVPLDLGVHRGQMDCVRALQGHRVDVLTAEREGLVVTPLPGERERRLEVVGDEHVVVRRREARVAGEDDRDPAGEGTPDRVPGLPAHDEAVAHRQGSHGLLVVGDPPRDLAAPADHPVLGHGRDDGELHDLRGGDDPDPDQTAIGALMPGCGS